MKPTRGTIALLFVLLPGCGEDEQQAPVAQRASLSDGTVAVVGTQPISGTTVRSIASAQGLSLEVARDSAVQDSLFAQAADARLSPYERSVVRRGELARALYQELEADARAKGPATDAELSELTQERWLTFDRPSAARTSHAVVLVDKDTDKARAKALAERILEAVTGAKDEADFTAKAKSVPTEGLNVRVEALPPVAADGRPVTPDNPAPPSARFDKLFSEAANAIAEVGGLSPVTETPFGFHVIFLAEKTPELRVPVDERRTKLAHDVIVRRIQRQEAQLLAQSKVPVEVSRAAESLTAAVRVRQ
ncbi:MAG: peptidyl-prolyl cis-trans isomerase [Myxococcales bacterium]|nr:peptidyl-prolyl cis-trans isomerase [Myxococcales bacterium]MCB9607241.1 peptidyl-prolyl cis-trans isomerase [Polyangiaceae bacterium]